MSAGFKAALATIGAIAWGGCFVALCETYPMAALGVMGCLFTAGVFFMFYAVFSR